MSNNTTPQELIELWEGITEENSRVKVGRADAVYHVGKLLADEWTPQTVAGIQAELADTAGGDYDAQYHYGYLTAWNTVSGLLKGDSLKTIAKNHG